MTLFPFTLIPAPALHRLKFERDALREELDRTRAALVSTHAHAMHLQTVLMMLGADVPTLPRDMRIRNVAPLGGKP